MEKKYDHNEVRCEIMAEVDCMMLLPGEPRTCCVCVGHDCKEAREKIERQKISGEIKK